MPLGSGDGLTVVLLGPRMIPDDIQQITRHPTQQLSFSQRSATTGDAVRARRAVRASPKPFIENADGALPV